MSPDLILIVDPDGARRRTLIAEYAAEGVKALGAKTLREARSILETSQISLSLIAGGLADLFEFDGFVRDCQTEHLLIYGMVIRRKEGLRYLTSARPAVLKAALRQPAQKTAQTAPQMRREKSDLILIGASTGGISALETVLRDFPADCPATLIVQHMRHGFAEGMVERFNQLLLPHVLLAQERQPLERGKIYLALDNRHHIFPIERNGQLQIAVLQAPPLCGHCPSVDMLFRKSAALLPRHRIAAALLTGMGNDGAEAMGVLRTAGGHTIAQDEASSIVWGMPRAAVELGAACEVQPLSKISCALLTSVQSEGLKQGQTL